MREALGIVEVQGLVYTIACADAAVKAANIKLLGYEPAKGNACFALKFTGNVGAVKAALDASLAMTRKAGKTAVGFTIPRPSDGCWELVNAEHAKINEAESAAVFEQGASAEPDEAETVSADKPAATCNLCGDPACPRHKGEPHEMCIHNNDEK